MVVFAKVTSQPLQKLYSTPARGCCVEDYPRLLYIDVNSELRKETNDLEKDSFKLMNNAVFGKTIENVRKHRDIVSKPNYHTTKLK